MAVTGDCTKQQRRGNTRQRIQDVALELFAEQDYEKMSLRDRRAARRHQDGALLPRQDQGSDRRQPLGGSDAAGPGPDRVGRNQPHTLDAKQEFVRRYRVALAGAEPLLRFMQSQTPHVV